MAGVDQRAVDQHDGGLENVEEGFVADDGALRAGVEVGGVVIHRLDLEVLDRPVDGAREDERRADVQGEQRLVHLGVVDAVVATAPVEDRREPHERDDDDQL